MSTPRDDPIVSYTDAYPPMHWDYIQEQRGEDSTSELWAEMTEDYHQMLERASQSFTEHLEFDHQTTKTAVDFCLDPTNCGPDTLEMWRSLKGRVLDRTENLDIIAEEDEPEEEAEHETPATLAEVECEATDSTDTTPEQPASLKPASVYDSSISTEEEPTDTQSVTSSDDKSIIRASPPDTTTPRKRSLSRRLRQSFGFLRRLVCYR